MANPNFYSASNHSTAENSPVAQLKPANSSEVDEFLEIFVDDPTDVDGGIFSGLLQQRDLFGNIRPREEIIPGLARGEVGLICSPTNCGKTTLLRNLTVNITAHNEIPFFNSRLASGKYVLYLDFEDSLGRAVTDFETIYGDDLSEGAGRLYLKVKPTFDEDVIDEHGRMSYHKTKLSLSHERHRNEILELIRRQSDRRDYSLMIVDTVISGFDIEDENNAAEIANIVMKPLAAMAAQANIAILATVHESTKRSGSKAIAAHMIRGSSVYGDLASVIYRVSYDEETGDYSLRLAKGKGVTFKPRRLRLEGRRFEVIEEIEAPLSTYTRVRELLLSGEFTPKEISDRLDISKRSVERILQKGKDGGGFVNIRRGVYTAK